jgi:hypothetical protein
VDPHVVWASAAQRFDDEPAWRSARRLPRVPMTSVRLTLPARRGFVVVVEAKGAGGRQGSPSPAREAGDRLRSNFLTMAAVIASCAYGRRHRSIFARCASAGEAHGFAVWGAVTVSATSVSAASQRSR